MGMVAIMLVAWGIVVNGVVTLRLVAMAFISLEMFTTGMAASVNIA